MEVSVVVGHTCLGRVGLVLQLEDGLVENDTFRVGAVLCAQGYAAHGRAKRTCLVVVLFSSKRLMRCFWGDLFPTLWSIFCAMTL